VNATILQMPRSYRAMAEDVMQHAIAAGLVPSRPAGATASLQLLGSPQHSDHALSEAPGLHLYGTEASAVQSLPGADRELAPGLTEAMVRFAVRAEYARTVEDVLARRSRLLFLDARRASQVAPRVAAVLAEELGDAFDAGRSLREFTQLAAQYGSVK